MVVVSMVTNIYYSFKTCARLSNNKKIYLDGKCVFNMTTQDHILPCMFNDGSIKNTSVLWYSLRIRRTLIYFRNFQSTVDEQTSILLQKLKTVLNNFFLGWWQFNLKRSLSNYDDMLRKSLKKMVTICECTILALSYYVHANVCFN